LGKRTTRPPAVRHNLPPNYSRPGEWLQQMMHEFSTSAEVTGNGGDFKHRRTQMAGRMGPVVQQLCRALLGAEATDLSDQQLLEVFIAAGAEPAFEALVRRHGALVWGVCRRVVGDHHDAEDAFQATFLVLARKAASLTRRDKLAGWLHGVASQTARKARALAA